MRLSMTQFSRGLYTKAIDEDVFSRAATVAFYFSFAFFPLLLFLVSLFGVVLENAAGMRAELFAYLKQIMPPSAFELVQATIYEVILGSSSSTLTFGLLIALWSASAGFDNLRIALNAVYNIREKRAWQKRTLIVLLLTICIGLLITIALGFIFNGPLILEWALGDFTPVLFRILGWFVILITVFTGFMMIFSVLPNYPKKSKRKLVPGAIFCVIFWIGLSAAFRIYLHYFDTYSKMYGSLGAMIILMLWLYLTALVILLGGIINSILMGNNEPEPEPNLDKLVEA
jgi:membrane protein